MQWNRAQYLYAHNIEYCNVCSPFRPQAENPSVLCPKPTFQTLYSTELKIEIVFLKDIAWQLSFHNCKIAKKLLLRTKQFSVKKKRFIACGDPNKWSLLYSFPIFPLNGLLHCVTIKWSCYGPQSTNKIIKTPTNGPPFFATIVVPNELPSSFQSYTLTGLNTYTQYLVSLKAYNPAGDGPETIVVVMTDEGGKKLSLNKNEIIDGDIELGSFWLNGGLLIRHHSYKCVEESLPVYLR